ncbi:hypothetical protein [Terrabacter sp. NPDC000476]|uniref:hypothetical protein n=1 Tax=Terrabacter sp. NPDC000476 TaxID=3154258 RepID=UPI00332E724E
MTAQHQHDGEPRIRPFADFLREHGRGRTHDELGEALHTLIARVKDTGKKGSLSLTISVEPMKKADERMVVVGDKIAIKLPEHDRPSAVWFVGKDGNLQRDDPDQLSFDSLREVPPPPGVNPTTGEITDTREAN